MPKGDREILKADPDDGTTPVANLLLEALAVAPLSGVEKGAVLYLWRQTYGWAQNGKRRKEAIIPLSAWAQALHTHRDYAAFVLRELVGKQVLIRRDLGQGKGYIYTTNTKINEWLRGSLIPLLSSFSTSSVNTLPQSKSSTVEYGKTSTLEGCKSSTPLATDLLSPKEILKKDIKKDNIYIVIFDHWNSTGIIQHEKLTEKIQTAIRSALKDYSADQVKTAIDNYALILNSNFYFFKYRWTLPDFLRRGLEKFLDLEVAQSNYRRDEEKKRGSAGKEKNAAPIEGLTIER